MAERTDYAVVFEQTDPIRIQCEKCGKEKELDVLGVRNSSGSVMCTVRDGKSINDSAETNT